MLRNSTLDFGIDRRLQAMDDSLTVRVFLFVELSLNLFRVKELE
jgi:hypothetical protein